VQRLLVLVKPVHDGEGEAARLYLIVALWTGGWLPAGGRGWTHLVVELAIDVFHCFQLKVNVRKRPNKLMCTWRPQGLVLAHRSLPVITMVSARCLLRGLHTRLGSLGCLELPRNYMFRLCASRSVNAVVYSPSYHSRHLFMELGIDDLSRSILHLNNHAGKTVPKSGLV